MGYTELTMKYHKTYAKKQGPYSMVDNTDSVPYDPYSMDTVWTILYGPYNMRYGPYLMKHTVCCILNGHTHINYMWSRSYDPYHIYVPYNMGHIMWTTYTEMQYLSYYMKKYKFYGPYTMYFMASYFVLKALTSPSSTQ